MVVALAREELGSAVQAFGDGRDGGREATFEGTITWSRTHVGEIAEPDAWSGFTVLQAKFQVKAKSFPQDNAMWLQQEIRSEISNWVKAAKNGARTRLPDYLIFVTNVELSAVARVGGIDTLTSYVQRKLRSKDAVEAGLRVKGFAIWHADQLRSMLDAHQGVRWAFPGLLTVGDVLSMLSRDSVRLGSLEVCDPLRQELLFALKADRWVRLSQSGGAGDAKLWLDDIAIDLPAKVEDGGGSVQAVRHVLEIGDTVLRPRTPGRSRMPHVVVVGGPGQGKSTISQLIAQAYRAAMLNAVDLGPSTREIVAGTLAALERLGLSVPGNLRWPVRIDLAKYAEELAAGSDVTLLRWISQQLSKRTEGEVTAQELRGWLAAWPWALILDGLDEVPSQASRRAVYEKIDDLLTLAEDSDADLLVVVTTRPTGYDERLPADAFRHLFLQRLPAEQAAMFAQQITDKRFTDDDEMRAKVAERMREAAQDPVTQRLMETPLQVTIMSFIVEKFPTLPPDRFSLFNLYYRTMFEREVAKGIPIARFLSQHRIDIDRLHALVGLHLQAASEEADGAEAVMSTEDLHALARRQFVDKGFGSEEAGRHATDLAQAATHRLVLLAPRDGGVGFDVRSLQELMAARSITEGEDLQVLERLRLIAHHPHWRNTWLLAAGHLLESSSRFQKSILSLLGNLDSDPHRLRNLFPTAPSLAKDILEDNLARIHPSFELGLVQVMFGALQRPTATDVAGLCGGLARLAVTSHRAVLVERLASAAAGNVEQRAAAGVLLGTVASAFTDHPSLEVARRNLALSEVEKQAVDLWITRSDGAGQIPKGQTVASYFKALTAPFELSSDNRRALEDGLAVLDRHHYVMKGTAPGTAWADMSIHYAPVPELLLKALANDEIAQVLDVALGLAPPPHWALVTVLGAVLKPAQDRLPVGPALLEAIDRDTEANRL